MRAAGPATNTVPVPDRYPVSDEPGRTSAYRGCIETRELRYFVAVAEELHFGRAADRLGIAQPPLSRAISQLERQLGVPLLQRTSRRVTLTAAGAVLLDDDRLAAAQPLPRGRRPGAGGDPAVSQGPVATGRSGSADHWDQEPGDSAASTPATASAATSCAAVTPEPQ